MQALAAPAASQYTLGEEIAHCITHGAGALLAIAGLAVLVVGLGCETNQIQGLIAQEGLAEGAKLVTFNIQDTGGTAKTVAKGVELIQAMLPEANRVARVPVPAKHLVVGLQCGGSDGYSGISANPALGAAVDRLVRHGGTAILSETPEIHGVEHMLTRRAVSPEVGQKLLDRLAWWTEYTRGHNGQFNGVVGPGNQAGGLANIVENSNRNRANAFVALAATSRITLGADLVELTLELVSESDRVGCACRQVLRREQAHQLLARQRRKNGLAEADAICGYELTDPQADPQGVPAFHSVDVEHVLAVWHGQVHSLVDRAEHLLEYGASILADAQLADRREPHLEDFRPRLIAAALLVLAGKAVIDQH